MRVECAVLCDSATLREGLLHILGAGVTQTTFPSFPANLLLTFAFRAVLEPKEVKPEHRLRLQLTNRHGDPQVSLFVEFRTEGIDSLTEEAAIAAPVPLYAFQLDGPGRFLIEVSLDQQRIGTIPLRVEQASLPS